MQTSSPSGARHKVLVIEDDAGICHAVARFLEQKGYAVVAAQSCDAAKQHYSAFAPDAVVTDYRLPDGEALGLITDFRRADAAIPIFVLTGYGSIDLAVQALKHGADEFLTKPIDLERLVRELGRALAKRFAQRRDADDASSPFCGDSAPMREFREQAQRLSQIDCSTLVLGETGTGKTLLARWLHGSGKRAGKPFVELNAAGLAPELMASELFGHERGAFTSAHAAKTGLFELADGGTLFLDEIGDIDASVQPKLLKAIEEKRMRRMGATKERSVDARVIAATHRDLHACAQAGTFRADLYYRLSTVTIEVPPLRARGDDIIPLARRIVRQTCATLERPEATLSAASEQALRSYSWPGNVRELKNALERALHMTCGNQLEPKDLRLNVGGRATTAPPTTLQQLERLHIERALAEHGKVEDAARSLGIPRSTMYQKLKVYGIPSLRPSAARSQPEPRSSAAVRAPAEPRAVTDRQGR